MLSTIDKLTSCLIFLAVFIVSGWTHGQGIEDPPDWTVLWQSTEDTEFDDSSAKLVAQTNLILQWGQAAGWNRAGVWEKTVELLYNWEASPDIETASEKYLLILDTIGWAIHEGGYLPAWESQLRDFYQNALRIATSAQQESLFLFHLASSLYRSDPYSLESMRRIEANLEQAALNAGDGRLAAHIQLFMGNIYMDWRRRSDLPEREDTSYGSLAVLHYRQALSMEDTDGSVHGEATAALEQLLQPGLRVDINNRFHPDDDVRVTIASRNVVDMSIRVDSIPWLSEDGMPASINEILDRLGNAEFDALTTVFESAFAANSDNAVDWQDDEIRIGDGLVPGWYAVEVSGGGLTDRSLLLVTAIDLVIIPRASGTMTLWAFDAQTTAPITNGTYHVLDKQGLPLFSGNLGARGMADIVMGEDDSWEEVHAHINGNPAYIKRDDLRDRPASSPWLIPDAVSVLPGDALSWVLISREDPTSSFSDGQLVLMPDGGVLIPQRRDDSNPNRFSVQMPQDIDTFGPLYLVQPDGTTQLLSHLLRSDRLPLTIELNGEQFARDRNFFVSSTPVGIRIYPEDPDSFEQVPYVRIIVEDINRAFVYSAEDGGNHSDSQVLFEHITRFADPTAPEAFWELPEISQADVIVPLRIKVFPLGSDTLLAESYLAMVPYRARVSLKSSQQIIPVGESVAIQVLNIERGVFHFRSLGGQLVAYRESWENRYIHRKKGTPLNEEEYNALPDRSLLGTAKTDYQLVERGVVREEVFRKPINLVNGAQIPVVFERHGYYRIEFDGRDNDLNAHYPEGPIELWVLPESGELDAFQSEEPRLIVEDMESGGKELLVLADRNSASILLDLQYGDDRSETIIIDPAASGFYQQLGETDAPLSACVAVIAGERRTTFLCQHFQQPTSAEWDVRMDRVNGLNPGSDFIWQAATEEDASSNDTVWAVYAEEEARLVKNLVLLQQKNHEQNIRGCTSDAVALDGNLPLFQPVSVEPDIADTSMSSREVINDYTRISSVYPELLTKSYTKGGFIKHSPIPGDGQQLAYELSGQLPSAAGRWSLTAFHPGSRTRINVNSWEFSTDLPIRTSVVGPPVIRVGDQAIASLEIENTTRQSLDLEVSQTTDGFLAISETTEGAFQLPGGDKVDISVPYEALRPGRGRLMTTVQAPRSMSSGVHASDVIQALPLPVTKAYLVPAGMEQWRQTFDFSEFSSPQLLVSSAIGAHLEFLWSNVREHYALREPLIADLVDWAVKRVSEHHGLEQSKSQDTENELLESLSAQIGEAGISWTPGISPDPWLSALVLWSLETFSSVSVDAFDEDRGRLRSYLETVLIDTSMDETIRLFVLRTLASRAVTDPDVRPSRIHAKTFLEFFQNRDQLQAGALAMLMETAQSFGFTEEVQLLERVIAERLQKLEAIEQLNLWDASLAYLVLSQKSSGAELRYRPLQVLIQNNGLIADNPGWEQAGIFLNMLAAFYWDGDFSIEGSVAIAVDDGNPVTVSLQPHGLNRGHWIEKELPEKDLALKLDTRLSDQPVLVTVAGQRSVRSEIPVYAGQNVTYKRQYLEQTLLSGSNMRTVDVDLDTVFRKGETLIQIIELQVEDGRPYAEIRFNVPAGCSLQMQGLSHEYLDGPDNPEFAQPAMMVMPQANPLSVEARIFPFSPGTHRFVLPFNVNWGGKYLLPGHDLRFPVSGQIRRIGSPSILTIATE